MAFSSSSLFPLLPHKNLSAFLSAFRTPGKGGGTRRKKLFFFCGTAHIIEARDPLAKVSGLPHFWRSRVRIWSQVLNLNSFTLARENCKEVSKLDALVYPCVPSLSSLYPMFHRDLNVGLPGQQHSAAECPAKWWGGKFQAIKKDAKEFESMSKNFPC